MLVLSLPASVVLLLVPPGCLDVDDFVSVVVVGGRVVSLRPLVILRESGEVRETLRELQTFWSGMVCRERYRSRVATDREGCFRRR